MTRRLWPLILLTALLAVVAFVRTLRAETARAQAVRIISNHHPNETGALAHQER